MNPDKHYFRMKTISAGFVLLLTCSVSNTQDESTRDRNGAAQYVAEAKLAEKRLTFGEAISLYEQGAILGHAESMNELGWIYFGSHDIPGRHFQNYPKAVSWFQRAADLNYAPAITQLGVMYGADGSEGVPEDDFKAAQFYMKAATMGDAYAMNHLGYV